MKFRKQLQSPHPDLEQIEDIIHFILKTYEIKLRADAENVD